MTSWRRSRAGSRSSAHRSRSETRPSKRSSPNAAINSSARSTVSAGPRPASVLHRLAAWAASVGWGECQNARWNARFDARSSCRDDAGHGRRDEERKWGWRLVQRGRPWQLIQRSGRTVSERETVILSGLTGGNQAVALAQVLEKTEAMNTLVLQEQRAFYLKGAEEPCLRGHAIKYLSSELGQVEQCWTDGGKPIYTAYFLKKENRVVVLFPAAEGYLDLPLTDKLAALSDDVTPKGLVKLLTRHGYAKLGRAERDGHKVDGFEVTHDSIQAVLAAFQEYKEVAFLFPVKGGAARVWVDVKSSLPVSIEAEMETGRGLLTGFQEGVAHFTAYDFRWGADIDPQLFVPDIPADYKRLDLQTLGK